MMEAFKEGHTLHIKHAWQLVKEAKEVFSKEETLQASLLLGLKPLPKLHPTFFLAQTTRG